MFFINKIIQAGLFISFAASATQQENTQVKATDQKELASESQTVVVTPVQKAVRLHVGPGLYIVEGEVGWSVNAGFSYRILEAFPLFMGVDAGASFISQSININGFDVTGDVASIRILPTILARFGSDQDTFRPYLGGSIGPVFEKGTVTVNGNGVNGSDSDSEVDLEVAIRPGVEFAFSETAGLGLEPRVGVQSGEFIFTPQVHGVFSF